MVSGQSDSYDSNSFSSDDEVLQSCKSRIGEEKFLASYDISKFNRPSVTTDIAAFSIYTLKEECYRRNPVHRLSVLLVKRGEHPYKDFWALPGGFLKENETIEECAYREIKEETNLNPVSLMPVGVFSKPERDPRGWVISNAFASVLGEEQTRIISGEDAADAGWFDVEFKKDGKECFLKLEKDEIVMTAHLAEEKNVFSRSYFKIIKNSGFAFDHAQIIASSLTLLRREATNIDTVFDFLPEKFTLASLQKVQETLLGTSLLTPNFRRKIADFVEETDEYTEGAGHRPARLYRRKYNVDK